MSGAGRTVPDTSCRFPLPSPVIASDVTQIDEKVMARSAPPSSADILQPPSVSTTVTLDARAAYEEVISLTTDLVGNERV